MFCKPKRRCDRFTAKAPSANKRQFIREKWQREMRCAMNDGAFQIKFTQYYRQVSRVLLIWKLNQGVIKVISTFQCIRVIGIDIDGVFRNVWMLSIEYRVRISLSKEDAIFLKIFRCRIY